MIKYIFLFFLPILANAQTNEPQRKLSPKEKADSLQISKYREIVHQNYQEGNVEECLTYIHKINTIAKKNNFWDTWATFKNMEAILLDYKGDHDKAVNIADSMLLMDKKNVFKDPLIRGSNIYLYYATLMTGEKQHEKALLYIDKAAEILKNHPKSKHRIESVLKNNAADDLLLMGNYNKAKYYLDISLKELDKSFEEKELDRASYLFKKLVTNKNLIRYYALVKDYPNATKQASMVMQDLMYYETLTKERVEAFKQNLLKQFLEIEKAIGNYKKAENLAKQRITIIENDPSINLEQLIDAYGDAGDLYRVTKQNSKAQEVFNKALLAINRISLKGPALYKIHDKLIRFYIETDNLASATKLLKQSVPVAKVNDELLLNGERESLANLLKAYGDLDLAFYHKTKKGTYLRSALLHYKNAYKYIDQSSQRYGTSLISSFKNVLNELNRSSLALCHQLYSLNKEQKYVVDALEIIEFNKAYTLQATLNKNKLKLNFGVPPALLEKERESQNTLTFISKQYTSKPTAELEQKLKKAYQSLDSIKKVYDEKYPKFNELNNIASKVNLTQLQQYAKEQETNVIDYFYDDAHLYTVSITPKQMDFNKKRIVGLDEKMDAYLMRLQNPAYGNKTDYIKMGKEMYSYFLQDFIDTEQNSLTIIPYGKIGLLPFEAFVNPSTKFIAQSHKVSYQHSVNLLLNREKNNLKNEFLVFAPFYKPVKDLASVQRGDYNDLYGSYLEVYSIDQHFKSKSFLNKDATKSNFLNNLGIYNHIHLATHAESDEDNALASKIVFNNNEYLYAHEIYNLSAKNDLLVLSACETGVGTIDQTDGINSLARAFSYAGVKSTLLSLWKVDDYATSKLMGYFYTNLKDGSTKDEALQNAKKQYLENASATELQHPYYWAGFVLNGDTSPVKQGLPLYAYFLFFGGMSVVPIWLFRKKLIEFFK